MDRNKKHYAYMLLCADGSIYSGYTTDPERRAAAHNCGSGAKYTRSRLPVKLLYSECFPTKSEALKREAALKKLSHAEKLMINKVDKGNIKDTTDTLDNEKNIGARPDFMINSMIIRRYVRIEDEEKLMALIKNEGEEWSCYWADEFSEKYKAALADSITYVAYEGDVLCGYSRSLNDCGFYIYVCDLLVMSEHRGKHIGKKLMECIYEDHPEQIVYAMSDVDEYYKKQGFRREGSIFEVPKSS